MHSFTIFVVGTFLTAVFSVDVSEIQKAIKTFESTTFQAKADSLILKEKIANLGQVYKVILGHLTDAKAEVSDDHKHTLKLFTNAVYNLKNLRKTEANERKQVKVQKDILRRLLLAKKWLTQDNILFEQRKKDKDEAECKKIQLKYKTMQSSRLLGDEEEEQILKEELKQAEIDAFDASEEKAYLNFKLQNEQSQWKTEVKLTANILNQTMSNLVQLKSKLKDKNKEISQTQAVVTALLKQNADLQTSIRVAEKKYKQDIGVLKSYQPAVQCYLAVRRDLIRLN